MQHSPSLRLETLFNGRWPDTILMDLDGTLVDSAPDLAGAVDQMLRALVLPVAGEERVRQWVGNGAAILVRRALAGQFDYEHGPAVSELAFKQALDLFYAAYTDLNGAGARVYPGVEAFLAEARARGCSLGVVTNKPHAFTGPLLTMMALDHWFDIAVSGDTLPVRKPDPAPLHHAMEFLGGGIGSTLMVGDSITDVRSARNAGIPVVAVRYGYNYGGTADDLGADIVVDSLAELL
ncbi:MAG: phosphoglycolate phosphatase [Marinobacter sp.]|uniref:phosphoglycolate phosphatase n=1 Tax=Marinobacter sp. TaxID=50741 RepID=UPI00299E3C27|nr:phosphoglycolate phosphatase [Marinobacter sp.]MDX1633566.1 phosphoglycolate phosphatase [Marinobacter sp.]